MNNQSPISNNQPIHLNRFDARQQHREARRAASGALGGAWIAGLLLILLGAAFLLENMEVLTIPLANWWSLFILIPAIGAFYRVLMVYRSSGNHWAAQVGSALLVGIALTLVSAAFLFSLNFTIIGPALIILAGLGILINFMFSSKG